MLFRPVLYHERKGRLSPAGTCSEVTQAPHCSLRRISEKAFSRASLTVEACVALPVFFVCMILVLQYANVYHCAVRLCGALTQTSEEMAVAACLQEFTDGSTAGELAGVTISAAYASAKVYQRAGDLSALRTANMLLSSFLEKDERIDLVMTYQVRSPVGMVKVPGSVFLQRA